MGDKARVFKVIKTPIDIGEHPEPIRQLLGYEFFQIEEERRRLRELSLDAPDPGFRARFLTIADDLAQDIGSALRTDESAPVSVAVAAPAAPAPAAAGAANGRTIYLAADHRRSQGSARRDPPRAGGRRAPGAAGGGAAGRKRRDFGAAVRQDLAGGGAGDPPGGRPLRLRAGGRQRFERRAAARASPANGRRRCRG